METTSDTTGDRHDVLMFRAPKDGEDDKFEKILRQGGFMPYSIPVLEFVFTNLDLLADTARHFGRYSCVVFTSARSVQAAVKACAEPHGQETLTPEMRSGFLGMTCYVVGPSTYQTATEAGFHPVKSDAGNAEQLAKYICDSMPNRDKPVLFPCGSIRKDTLPNMLREDGFILEEVAVYETVRNHAIETSLHELLQEKGLPEFVVFFSPSGVQFTWNLVTDGTLPLHKLKVAAIGRTTEKELRSKGVDVHCVAQSPDPAGLIGALTQVDSRRLTNNTTGAEEYTK